MFGFGVVVLCSRTVTVVFVVTLAFDWQVHLTAQAFHLMLKLLFKFVCSVPRAGVPKT